PAATMSAAPRFRGSTIMSELTAGLNIQMADEYTYTLAQCDVPIERHSVLQSYRDKRRLWLSWISPDEHHAIWTVLSSMVWTDVAFKSLTNFARGRRGERS